MKKPARHCCLAGFIDLERVKGIEPSYEAWEAAVLPLNYTRDAPDYRQHPPAVWQALCASVQNAYP